MIYKVFIFAIIYRASARNTREKNNSSLLVIVGSKDTLTFFNFLINSKHHVVSTSGYLAGVPPTILSPVAFVGASLRSLKVNSTPDMTSYMHYLFNNFYVQNVKW